MASGNYPISKNEEVYKKLETAIEQIQECLEDVEYDDSQFDNAASDGGYRERLFIAIDHIKYCMRNDR